LEVNDNVTTGIAAETTVTVTSEMPVGHFVANMPRVCAPPMIILHKDFVSGGMNVKVRHLAATPVGRRVHAISRVIKIELKSVVFEVEA
jgi:fluoroacetyl-CoA thioesterase